MGGTGKLQALLTSAIPLTLPIAEATPYGPFTATDVQIHYAPGALSRASTSFAVNVHGMTHVDLPWTIPFDTWEAFLPRAGPEFADFRPPGSQEIGAQQSAWRGPRIFDALIVDATRKADILLHTLRSLSDVVRPVDVEQFTPRQDPDLPAAPPELAAERLLLGLTQQQYLDLLLQLRITPEELSPAVDAFRATKARLDSTVLIIKTRWSDWRPRTRHVQTAQHSSLAVPRPFLLHPFLDLATADLIRPFAGVGVDAFALDCPIYDVDDWQHPPLQAVRQRVLAGRTPIRLPASARAKFVQAYMLAQQRIYLTNLAFPTQDVETFWSMARPAPHHPTALPHAIHQLLLVPLAIGDEAVDAVPVSAFLLGSPT